MARVHLIIPDEDRDPFVHQARREGLTSSAWLRAAARERLEQRQRSDSFESPSHLEEFFRECDALEGSDRESEWTEHLRITDESRRRSAVRLPASHRHPLHP